MIWNQGLLLVIVENKVVIKRSTPGSVTNTIRHLKRPVSAILTMNVWSHGVSRVLTVTLMDEGLGPGPYGGRSREK